MIITQTPFRMSFFGGGTDMENFFKEYGGAVLSTTFDKYCYVNVRHLPRFFDYSTELSYSKTERVTSIEDIQHPAIRNAMKMLDMHEIRLTYALFIYSKKPKVYEKGMKMILSIIVISALYGIIEALVSYNVFEQYFAADYIRGYYGTALYRIASIFMHPIACGQVFLIGFWLAAFFYEKWKRVSCLIIIALGIYYTKSRSIWGGLVFSIAILMLVKMIEFLAKHRIQKRKLIYIPFTVVCIYFLYKMGVFDTIINSIYERIMAASGSTSELARQSMSIYTLNYMIHNASVLQKMFGYGMDSSKSWIYKSGAFVKAYDAIDNSYLTIMYEFGLVGLLTFVILIIRKVIECFYKNKSTTKLKSASIMVIVACAISFYFYDFYGWLPIYILFIYCVVSSKTSNYYITESRKNEKITNN